MDVDAAQQQRWRQFEPRRPGIDGDSCACVLHTNAGDGIRPGLTADPRTGSRAAQNVFDLAAARRFGEEIEQHPARRPV